MDANTERYLHILRRHDDPVRWEWPRDFDYEAAERRFLAFVADLQRACGLRLDAETGAAIQDASFRGQVFLRGRLLRNELDPEETVVLRVSNWGELATVSDEAAIHPAALVRIKAVLEHAGYLYIPPRVLALPYTGENPGVTGIATWWIRYFDWV